MEIKNPNLLENIIYIDSVCHVHGVGFFLEGWTIPLNGAVPSVSIYLDDTFKTADASNYFWTWRDDVFEHFLKKEIYLPLDATPGFIAFFPYSGRYEYDRLYYSISVGGNILPGSCHISKNEYSSYILSLFDKFDIEKIDNKFTERFSVFAKNITSFIEKNLDHFVFQFGISSKDSFNASFLIPCYPDLQLAELQLASFSRYMEKLSDIDIIYLLNSNFFDYEYAEYLSTVYNINFRVIYLGSNFGYSIANNAGVVHALSDNLYFINSDVFINDYSVGAFVCENNIDNKSITGIKLLYGDGTLQHAGLYLEKLQSINGHQFRSFLTGSHYSKGLYEDKLSHDNDDISMVTGAFLNCSKDVFSQVGKFRTDYVLGDYEDIDFCIRANRLGIPVRFRSDVSAYHFEGVSKRFLNSNFLKIQLYNRTLFNIFSDAE